MTSRMLAVVAASFAVALGLTATSGAGAKPTATHDRRVTLVPGFSLSFPSGWFACGALAPSLPAPAEAKTFQSTACAHTPAPVKARLYFGREATKTLIETIVQYDTAVGTETILNDLDADMIVGMKERVCTALNTGLPQHRTMANCALVIRRNGGHTWIGVSFDLVGEGPKMPVRQALLPYGDKSIVVQFSLLSGTPAQLDKTVDDILDSVAVDASAIAAAPDEIISLTAAPGVTLSVPKGIRSCDEATDALLGNAPGTPIAQRDDLCVWPETKGEFAKATWFMLADLRVGHGLWIGVTRSNGHIVTQAILASATPERLAEASRKGCEVMTTYYAEKRMTATQCESRITDIAGRRALAFHLLLSEANKPGKHDVNSYLVPLDEGQLWVFTSTPVYLQSITKPELDAILASLTVQE